VVASVLEEECQAEIMELRNRACNAQVLSYRKMGERGIEEEMEAIRGTWSEVSREREEREEEG
jgi:hypothetical protein